MSLIQISGFKFLPVIMLNIRTPTIAEKKKTEHFKVFLFLASVNLDIFVLDHFVIIVV